MPSRWGGMNYLEVLGLKIALEINLPGGDKLEIPDDGIGSCAAGEGI